MESLAIARALVRSIVTWEWSISKVAQCFSLDGWEMISLNDALVPANHPDRVVRV